MSLKLDLLLEAINEIDKEDVIEESAKWKEYYDKTCDRKPTKDGSSKQYGQVAGRMIHDKINEKTVDQIKELGKDISSNSKARLINDLHNNTKKHFDEKYEGNDHLARNALDTHNYISKKKLDLYKRVNDARKKRAAMGESVEDHIAFADTLLELLN